MTEKAKAAEAPWDILFAGTPSNNGSAHVYVIDRGGRKIAAVWGKQEEKEQTACLMSAAPELLELVFQYKNDLLHPVTDIGSRQRRLEAIDAAIALAVGKP